MTEFCEQTLEPVNGSGGLDSHAYRSVKIAVERPGLAALVIQAPLEKQLSGGFFRHGNLLIAGMKIATYKQHCSAPFPEPWSFNSNQVYSVEGADAVIQSGRHRAKNQIHGELCMAVRARDLQVFSTSVPRAPIVGLSERK